MSDTDAPVVLNDKLVLISGESGTGKTASLKNIPNKENWILCNCEAGKRPPFKAKWFGGETRGSVITNPYEVHEAFEVGATDPDIHGIIVDTATFLMEMFESQFIVGQANTQKGWADYFQFWKTLMQVKVAKFGKPVIILAHTLPVFDEQEGIYRKAVPVKGALKNNGLEAYFSTVVTAKRVSVKDLKDTKFDLLKITEEEQALGFKHVFQTKVTAKTIGERIRSPMGMFGPGEGYMDNDAALLLNHLDKFYGD
jgi:hypothetical protein